MATLVGCGGPSINSNIFRDACKGEKLVSMVVKCPGSDNEVRLSYTVPNPLPEHSFPTLMREEKVIEQIKCCDCGGTTDTLRKLRNGDYRCTECVKKLR
jgi:hypothetical protein